MPIIKSAIKKARQDIKARKRNQAVRLSFRDAVKDVKKLASAGDPKKTGEALKKAYSEIDKAAKRKVLHKNAANRRKSRLAAFIKNAQTAKKVEKPEKAKKEKSAKENKPAKEEAKS